MKTTLLLLVISLTTFGTTNDYVLTKSEWVNAFKEAHSILFCQNIVTQKFCKSIKSSDCMKQAEQSTLDCAKKMSLPAYIQPGNSSNEAAVLLGSCIARSFEKYKRQTASCN